MQTEFKQDSLYLEDEDVENHKLLVIYDKSSESSLKQNKFVISNDANQDYYIEYKKNMNIFSIILLICSTLHCIKAIYAINIIMLVLNGN